MTKTAKTSERLAQVIHALGLFDLEKKARANEYHDFLSEDPLCSMTLEQDLRRARDATQDRELASRIEAVRQRHLNGEFDASLKESDDWANSKEGRAALRELTKGKKR
jgi:hypothetical protein